MKVKHNQRDLFPGRRFNDGTLVEAEPEPRDYATLETTGLCFFLRPHSLFIQRKTSLRAGMIPLRELQLGVGGGSSARVRSTSLCEDL